MRKIRSHLGLSGALLLAWLAGCSANSGPRTNAPAAAPVDPPLVSLALSPTSLEVGQSAIVTWASSNDTSCAASGAWSGPMALSNASGQSLGPFTVAGTYVYGITCAGAGGTTAASRTVTVGAVAAPTIQLALVPSVVMPGNPVLITWTTTNATSCTGSSGTGSDGWQGHQTIQEPEGFNTGPLASAGQYAYDLTCLGPGGSTQATRIVTVSAASPPAPPSLTFSAQRTLIQPGGSATLTWTAAGATSCTASGGSGADGWSGVQAASSTGTSVGPIGAGTYSYTLTCSNAGGSTAKSVTITSASTQAPAVAVNIAVTPARIIAGASANLTWSSSNAATCSAAGSWSGVQPLQRTSFGTGTLTTAGVYSYTLTCSGPGGSSTSTALLTVTPAAAAITNFLATPAAIQVGQSATLSWASTGATSCTASGGGSSLWSGAQSTTNSGLTLGAFGTAGTYLFTLSCTGPGGTGTPQTATVVVSSANGAPPAAAVVTSFNASPSTLQTGQSTTLSWSSNGATSCTAGGGSGADAWSGALPATGMLSIGPLNTAGNFVFTLTCSGPGGAGPSGAVSVDVSSVPPAASVNSFSVTPGTLQMGHSATVAWSSSNATSCAATGGTGSDNWNGTMTASDTGRSIGPVNASGPVTYTITCTGSGGASAPNSVTIDVTATAPAATITSFTATPHALQTGQATTLAWTSANATACAAGGGTGSDGWSGAVPAASSGTVLTAINAAGTYVYTLTCSGSGGTSTASSATVTVTSAAPPATLDSFSATPSTLQVGQSTSLAWSSSGASACSASGGSGADGWSGTVSTSSSGRTVGPLNAAGTYVYTLSCTGPGGSGTPASIAVTVNTAPTAATIVSFTATPSTLQAGQATSLAWSTANATSCTASGGTGSDGWNGAMAASSSGTSTGVLSAGTVTYTLTCTGPGGASAPSSVNVTVDPAAPSQPTAVLQIDAASTAQIQPGSSPTLSWSSSSATSCVASGGTGSDGWSGTRATSSTGMTLGPITTPGTYSYTLTCTGAGGSGSSTVQLTVVSAASYDCGVPGLAMTALVAPAASVTSSITGVLCLLDCSVAHPGYVIDSTPTNYATLIVPLGLAGGVSLDVAAGTSFPAGRQVGFVLANGSTLLDASLLGGIAVETLLNGNVQEVASIGTLLSLQAAGLLTVDQYAGFAGFTTTKPFDSIGVVAGSLASLASTVRVYSACVSQ